MDKRNEMKKYLSRLNLYLLLAVLALATSCQEKKRPILFPNGRNESIRYAQQLKIVDYDGYTIATIANPWKEGEVLHRYVLIPKGREGDKLLDTLNVPKGKEACDIVRTPVERAVVFTSPHCQLMYDIGCAHAIVGVCDLEYMNIPDIHKRVKEKDIANCGSSMQPSIEQVIASKPEVMLISLFENNGGYGKLAKLGVPIIETADYMETSPMGRAEWMKFYGRLFATDADKEVTCEKNAKILYANVEKDYVLLCSKANDLPLGLSILTERKMGGVWYVPGGNSTMGILLKDAHAKYVFADDTHSGSLALSPEQVLAKADSIDVWAFKYLGDKPLSKQDLLQEFGGYSVLKAFRSGNIYECNTSSLPYFEKTSFHPEVLLREFILLSHPEVKDLGKLQFYTHL